MMEAVDQSTRKSLWAWPARHPGVVCVMAGILLLLAALSIGRMKPDASLAGMFPENDPAAESLFRVLDHFSAVEELLVLVTTPPADRASPPDTARLLAFAQRLDNAIQKSPDALRLTDGVIYRADAETRRFFEKVLVPNALFYLDDAQFAAAQERLTREEMVKQFRQNEAMVSAPGPAAEALAKAFLQDPLRLREFLMARLAASRPFKTYGDSDAFLSPDGYSLLIRVRGRRPPSDIDFSDAITRTVQRIADQENTDALQVELTGAYAIAATSARAIRHDMIVNITSSVILLQGLFFLAYRRPIRLFALAFGPVVAGVLCGLGVYVVGSTSMTPLTAVVGSILAGMGIDYSIQYLSSYTTRRSAGDSAVAAAEATSRLLGKPMFAAWLTSVIGFVAVASSSVPALRNFAVVGALGLAGTFIAAVGLLPAVLVLWDRRGQRIIGRTYFRLPLDGLLLRIVRYRRTAIALCCLSMAGAIGVILWPGTVLPLEPDLSVMHPSPNPALAAQEHLAERMGTSPDSLLIHLQADSPDQLQSLAHEADRRLRSASVIRDAGVTGTYGIATLLPDPKVTAPRLQAIGPAVADRVVSDLQAVVENSLFAPTAFEPYAKFLRHILTRTTPPALADLVNYPSLAATFLPTDAVDKKTDPTEAITLVFVKNPLSNRIERQRVITVLRAALDGLPGATLTGMSVVANDSEVAIRRDLPRFIAIAIAFAAAYLLVHFRAIVPAILSVLPALFSLICLLAIMRLTGQKLNMINLVAAPILIGIDVDYGIFLVSIARQRSGNEPITSLISRIAPSCHAIVMCAITTVLGFGSLVFTSVPAIRSLGFAVGIGVMGSLTATFLLLVPVLTRDRR